MKNNSGLISFISAFCLHLLIGGVLLLSVDFKLPKEKPKEAVTIIKASVVSQKMFDDLAQLKEDKLKQEKQKKNEARRKKEREEAEKKRQAALLKKQADEKKQAEVLRKKLESERIEAKKILAAKVLKEKKEAAEALKRKKVADALKQKQAADALKLKKAEEKKALDKLKAEKLIQEKAIEDARVKAEEKAIQDAKVKAEKEIKRKQEEAERIRQSELDRQMEAEFSDDFSSARNAKQLSEIAKYEALIQGKISRNWAVDPTMKGRTCTLAIKLAPDGLVISAQMSSGDRRLCDSARRAALKAKTLPIPKDPEIAPQFRDFDITLEPDV